MTMRKLFLLLLTLVSAAAPAAAQATFSPRVQPGVRVRVWLPEAQRQQDTPWQRQLLRATVVGVGADSLTLSVPGSSGSLDVARADMRRLEVSLGTSRVASAFERAVGFAIAGAISTALDNDPAGTRWPNYRRDWRAAEEGAKWGAAIGAVVGFVLPTERWRRVRLR
jgi:hypothetical protein